MTNNNDSNIGVGGVGCRYVVIDIDYFLHISYTSNCKVYDVVDRHRGLTW